MLASKRGDAEEPARGVPEPKGMRMKLISDDEVVRRGGSTTLVVMLHSLDKGPQTLQHVRKAVEEALPDADLMVLKHPVTWYSNVDVIRLTEELVARIGEAVAEREVRAGGYQQIILVGHSIGALLLRKAYVFAK